MKKLILGVGLAALLATPVLAQSYNPNYGIGRTRTPPTWAHNAGGSAFAYAPRGLRAAGADEVYVDGQYVGADPDPNVRLQLQRDPPDGGH